MIMMMMITPEQVARI